MNALALALAALRGISTLLGEFKIRGPAGGELLGLLGSLIEEGHDTFEELKAFTTVIDSMVTANRGPTPDEWDALRARGQAAHDRLQAVKAELEPEPEAEVEEEETPEAEPVPEAEPEAEEEADPTPTPEGQP
jgi:hypothetical protein